MSKYKFTHEQLRQMQANPWMTLRERRIFKLFYRQGMRIEDIAAELNVTRSTVSRALKKIRENGNKMTLN